MRPIMLVKIQWFLKKLLNLKEESKSWAFTISLLSIATSMWTPLKSRAVCRSLSKISTIIIPKEVMLQQWAKKSSVKTLKDSRYSLVTTKSSLKPNSKSINNKNSNNCSSKSKCSHRITMLSFCSKVLYHRSALYSGIRRFHTGICLALLVLITTSRTATIRPRWTTTWCPMRTKVSIGQLSTKFAIPLRMSLATLQARTSIPSSAKKVKRRLSKRVSKQLSHRQTIFLGKSS